MDSTQPLRGQSLGVPGGGLDDASWAANADVARIGKVGEEATAHLLDETCCRPGGATVIHDVTIPGMRANIDHVVVSGLTVWLIDSKRWRPGFVWSFAGRTRRGWKRFPPADKKTLDAAETRLGRHLRGKGVQFEGFRTSTVVVWPTTDEPLSVWAVGDMGRAEIVTASGLRRRLRRLRSTRTWWGKVRTHSADPGLVSALAALLVTPAPSAPAPMERPHERALHSMPAGQRAADLYGDDTFGDLT